MSAHSPEAFLQEKLAEKRRFQTLVDALIDPEYSLNLEVLPQDMSAKLLQRALFFAFARTLQQGPDSHARAPLQPHKLHEFAILAARAGRVPLETPGMMASQLNNLQVTLIESHLWSEQARFWWQPLHTTQPLTALWLSWESRLQQPFQKAWAEPLESTPFLAVIPNFVNQGFIAEFHQTLAQAYAAGALGMTRGGVGRGDQLSDHRTDEVRFLDGQEPDWRDGATMPLALLARWLRFSLVTTLGEKTGLDTLFAPQRAMLARYPAPSRGYAAHIDNPGKHQDNGRALTVLLYLNPPEHQPQGGQLTFWKVGSNTHGPPDHVIQPQGGSLVCFDSRQWIHQVEPVKAGPARWAISLWLNDRDTGVKPPHCQPLTPTDILLQLDQSPLPNGFIGCHHLDHHAGSPALLSYPKTSLSPKVGFLCTTYRGGDMLKGWCEHHLALGAARLYLIFDHLSEPSERFLADELVQLYGTNAIYIGDGESLLKARWPGLPNFPDRDALMAIAQESGTSWSVAARQSLNASALLAAFQQGIIHSPPDWLVHIDTDERFVLDGQARGGTSLGQHFGLAQALGWRKIRYANHELLPPWQEGEPARFKLNPRLGEILLGKTGWPALSQFLKMGQEDPRPYFNGYHNGKSAVAIEAGLACAGVHDWYLKTSEPQSSPFLAGPSILHFHCPTPPSFVGKYLSKAAQKAPSGLRPFPLSPMEEAAHAVVQKAKHEGWNEDILRDKLRALYQSRTHFSEADLELLETAKLIRKMRSGND